MRIENRFLLNFAASYSEGGYKRLYAYASWFSRNGGAWFAIHPRCSGLMEAFPNNHYFVIERSRFGRLYDDWGYLDSISRVVGQPDVYYAYGIPLYFKVGRLNWFHLSNILTLGTRRIPLSLRERLKLVLLGRRIRRGLALADVISAESQHSLSRIRLTTRDTAKLFLSVNGNDDELGFARDAGLVRKDNLAAVLGTHRYKALGESWQVFQALRSRNPGLTLLIIGDAAQVPGYLRRQAGVVLCGMLQRAAAIDCLRRTKFYISTTYAENSSNSVAEGIFHADQSFISDIAPNRELLNGARFREVSLPGLHRRLLYIRRDDLPIAKLRTWEAVVSEWRTAALRALHDRQTPERTAAPLALPPFTDPECLRLRRSGGPATRS